MSTPPPPDAADRGHLDALDGLRALAIFLVVARHSIRFFWPDLSRPFLPLGPFDAGTILLNGWCGVDLFFVLSGFLITRQLLSRMSTGTFFKRRYCRIAPAYYLILTLASFGLFPPYPMVIPVSVWSYVYHLLFLDDYLPKTIVPLFWTLAVEAKFYLLAPLLVLGLQRLPSLRARCAALAFAFGLSIGVKALTAALWLPHTVPYAVYFPQMRTPFHLNLDGFIGGMTAAFLWHDAAARAHLSQPRIANLCFFSGLALFVSLTGFTNLVDTGVGLFGKVLLTPLLALAFSGMLAGLLGGAYGSTLFRARPLRFIATISYSLYLTHSLFIMICFNAAQRLTAGHGPVLQWLVFLIPYLGLSLMASTVLYIVVERPFINWSKRSG